jgi:hypothetical protein
VATELVLVHQDFAGNEIQNVVIQNLASAPSSPKVGQIYFDTTLNKYRVFAGAPISTWVNLDGSSIPDNTITSAKIVNDSIMDADINSAAGIALSKLATDPRARSTHSGTQLANTISDFDNQVRTNRPNQLAVPNADLSLANFKITNLADPQADTDGANKRYVDLARAGIRLKDAVRAATTANITLSGAQTIDGVSVAATNRVLVKNQTNGAENGIYVAAAGAWARATDADAFAELQDGATVFVQEGSTQANTTWAQINTLTALTDPQSWAQQGAAVAYTAGAGIELVGQDLRINAGNGIAVEADGVKVDPAVVVRKSIHLVGDGAATSIDLTHNLGNQWAKCEVYENSGLFRRVRCGVEAKNANTLTLTFNTAPASNAYRAFVEG